MKIRPLVFNRFNRGLTVNVVVNVFFLRTVGIRRFESTFRSQNRLDVTDHLLVAFCGMLTRDYSFFATRCSLESFREATE